MRQFSFCFLYMWPLHCPNRCSSQRLQKFPFIFSFFSFEQSGDRVCKENLRMYPLSQVCFVLFFFFFFLFSLFFSFFLFFFFFFSFFLLWFWFSFQLFNLESAAISRGMYHQRMGRYLEKIKTEEIASVRGGGCFPPRTWLFGAKSLGPKYTVNAHQRWPQELGWRSCAGNIWQPTPTMQRLLPSGTPGHPIAVTLSDTPQVLPPLPEVPEQRVEE